MKKLILASAAVAALASAAPAAMASQAAADPTPWDRPGFEQPQAHWPAPYMLPDGRWVVPQAYAPAQVYRPYAYRGRLGDIDGDGIRDRHDEDRDGDGTRNSRDRYPDDYRYR